MFLDMLVCVFRKWFVIILNVMFCASLAFLFANFSKRTFESSAVLKLNEESSLGMAGLMDKFPIKGMLGGSAGGSENSYLFLEILASREVQLELLNDQRLDTIYRKEKRELLLKLLSKDLGYTITTSGMIEVSSVQSDSVRACRILEAFLRIGIARYDLLQKKRVAMSVSFLRDRESEVRDSFEMMQDSLLDFYRKNMIFDAEEQAKKSLQFIAEMETQKAANEVEKGVANSMLGGDASKSRLLRVMDEQYSGQIRNVGKRGVFLEPTRIVPLVVKERKLMSKLGIYSSAYQTIVKERMATEAKFRGKIEPIQVIQSPYVPDWKIKPKRAVWLLVGAATGFLLGLAGVILHGISKGVIRLHPEFVQGIRRLKGEND